MSGSGLHGARRLLGLRPAHRRGRADAGAHHRDRRRLPRSPGRAPRRPRRTSPGSRRSCSARARQLGLSLTPGEVRQIMRQTADDLTDPAKGYRPGWDRLTGWGRVNAARAVGARGARPDPARRRHHGARAGTRRWPARRSRSRGPHAVAAGRSSSAAARSRRSGAGSRAAGGSGRRRAPAGADRPARRSAPGGWTLRLRCDDPQAGDGRGPRLLLRARATRALQRGFPRDLAQLRRGVADAGQPRRAARRRDRARHERGAGARAQRPHRPRAARLAAGRCAAAARPALRRRIGRVRRGLPRHAGRRRRRGRAARRRSWPRASTAASTPGRRAAGGCAASRCGSTCAAPTPEARRGDLREPGAGAT